MAVDTQDKRASVLGLGLAALLVLPSPGAIDQPDRQHVAYSYRGITAAVAVVLDPVALPTNTASYQTVMTAATASYQGTMTAATASYSAALETDIAEWGQ